MKKVFAGALLALTSVLVYKSCTDRNSQVAELKESSMLIQQKLQKVAKLVVTEGHFAEVYTYADSKELFGPLFTADKKALVVVNAKVTVAYDLAEVDFKVDEVNKTVDIARLPKPEIDINPDFEYYDVQADYLNPFKADDYNAIKKNVSSALLEKVKASSMLGNAENRLLSELAQLLILTDTMGWTLVYEGNSINSLEELRLDGGGFMD